MKEKQTSNCRENKHNQGEKNPAWTQTQPNKRRTTRGDRKTTAKSGGSTPQIQTKRRERESQNSRRKRSQNIFRKKMKRHKQRWKVEDKGEGGTSEMKKPKKERQRQGYRTAEREKSKRKKLERESIWVNGRPKRKEEEEAGFQGQNRPFTVAVSLGRQQHRGNTVILLFRTVRYCR